MSETYPLSDALTARFSMPMLFAGQAEKELTHNEALVVIDALLAASVEGVAGDPDALTPQAGQCWLIGAGASGAWAGMADAIALWTGSGWRCIVPQQGQQLFGNDIGARYVFGASGWHASATLSSPSGGSVIDVEARATIDAIAQLLALHGLAIAT